MRRVEAGIAVFSLATAALWLGGCLTLVLSGLVQQNRGLLAAECTWYFGAIASLYVFAAPPSKLQSLFGRFAPHLRGPAIFVAIGLPAVLLLAAPETLSFPAGGVWPAVGLLVLAALGLWLCWSGQISRAELGT